MYNSIVVKYLCDAKATLEFARQFVKFVDFLVILVVLQCYTLTYLPLLSQLPVKITGYKLTVSIYVLLYVYIFLGLR